MSAAGPVRRKPGKTLSRGGENDAKARQKLASWLTQKFFVRFHITLILAFSIAVGLLATRFFFHLGLETMHWRWPIALLAAYVAFLAAVRVWLAYIGLGRYLSRDTDWSELANCDFSSSGNPSGGSAFDEIATGVTKAAGQQGHFGGGGASGDFSTGISSELANTGNACADAPVSGFSLPNIDLDAGGDDGCLPVVILAIVVALLAAVFGVGIYVVWQAPLLLAEVAFEAALAAGLVRAARRVDEPGWIGGAISASWKPFIVILLFSMVVAALGEKYAPQARTLPQLIHILSS